MYFKFALVLVVLLGAAVRFITLPNLMIFTSDEMYESYIAQTIIKNFHIIWIGTSVLGFDLYLGPFWIYIIYPFLTVSNGDPLILGYITTVLGVLTIPLVFWLGKKLFNARVGLIAALLYAFLPLVIYNEQKPYPPGVPFLTLLMALALYMAKYSGRWWILFAAAYGMVFHIHLSLILFIFVALYWAFLYRKLLSKKIILLSVLTFILMVSPLVAFDYFHKASNITAPVRLLQSVGKGESRFPPDYHLGALFDTLGRVFYLAPYKNNSDEVLFHCALTNTSTRTNPIKVLSFLAIISFIYFITRKSTWKEDNKRLLVLLSLVFLIPFIFLPGFNPVEYYLVGFFPLLFLLIGAFIEQFKKPTRSVAYALVIIIAVLGIFTVMTAKGDFGLLAKKKLITRVFSVIGDNPYELKHEGLCHKWEGWRYLFSVYGRRPERSTDDEIYAWLYPDQVSKVPAKYLIMVTETRAHVSPSGYKMILEEGGFSIYILEN